MKLEKLTPNLMVEDVDLTVQFYAEMLGFRLDQSVPETPPFDWASIKSGTIEIMFQSRSSLAKEIPSVKDWGMGGSLTFYIEMQGLQELYGKMEGRTRIVQELHETFYGMREFSMRDPNGYILAFAERIDV